MLRKILIAGLLLLLSACQPAPVGAPVALAVRLSPAAIVQFSADLSAIEREWPLPLLPKCQLWDVYAPRQGATLAIELACPSGLQVLLLDSSTNQVTDPLLKLQTDSRFLAWHPNGESLYLLVDTLNNPRVMRFYPGTKKLQETSLPQITYHIDIAPDGKHLLHAGTKGLGFGSEISTASLNGRNAHTVMAQPLEIIARPVWSSDGSQIAYISMPDAQTPFPEGQLWLLAVNSASPEYLAEADAGHGYAPAWSPDGSQIAFVARDPQETGFSSNIHIVETVSRRVMPLTAFRSAIVETPLWSPDGKILSFNHIVDGTITIWVYDFSALKLFPLSEPGFCCLVWMRK